jgi:hypothetical protein
LGGNLRETFTGAVISPHGIRSQAYVSCLSKYGTKVRAAEGSCRVIRSHREQHLVNLGWEVAALTANGYQTGVRVVSAGITIPPLAPKLTIDFEPISGGAPPVTCGTPFQAGVAYRSMRDFGAQSRGPR